MRVFYLWVSIGGWAQRGSSPPFTGANPQAGGWFFTGTSPLIH